MNHEHEQDRGSSRAQTTARKEALEPGQSSRSAVLRKPKHALASGLVQRKTQDAAGPRLDESAAVQAKARDESDAEDVRRLATTGISGSPSALPFLEQIQRSFHTHDISGVQAHVGGPAARACQDMGAVAYATGNHVAFEGAPDLHTAAHEAAHVVQQRAGVQLSSGVGQAGDEYERHADMVADAVVAGRSAEALLSNPGQPAPVQQLAAHEPPQAVRKPACPTCGSGNCACDKPSTAPETQPSSSGGRPATQFDVSREIASHRGAASGPLQVSDPSDTAEREAERIAEQLFPASYRPQLAPPGPATVSAAVPTQLAQRKEAGGEGASCTTCGHTGMFGNMADVGSALSKETRGEMESAFGADFGGVRIHTNSGASQLARSLNATAFTYGNDIFFAEGKYEPNSVQGKRLLAHELTHTVQQRNAIATLAREGEGRTTLQCVNENLSSAGVAGWLLAIVGTTCGLIGALAGSPSGPGAAGTAAFGAAVCIAGVIGASVGAVLGILTGCLRDPNFKSRGAYLSSAAGSGAQGNSAVAANPGDGGGGAGGPSASVA